ncbi:MAG TPA: APC family permease [Pyrinomonadaceae bacterium]|nr:APC family permease [Pyrinomonadaceae bacterium]
MTTTHEAPPTENFEDDADERSPKLIRGVGVMGATTLNMIDMIGVGPFITIPLIIAAMGGPQAMLGWIVGAVLVICDGLVWAELGAMFPGSGGAYRYLNEIYGRGKLGRLMSFLFIWQLTFSAPLSMASGCIGFALYATYAFPTLSHTIAARDFHLPVPLLGQLDLSLVVGYSTFVAIGVCLFAVFLLYRKITIIERFSNLLWVGVMLTIIWIIGSGLWFFNPALAFDFPPDAFTLDARFFTGLGAALLIAVYDYWGYYNVCYFGGEVRDPARTIPRAVLLSIILVAVIYIVMNISILGVIPWREFAETANSDARRFVISSFMERLYGHTAGLIATVLIMWTAFASVFSLLLGYSRVPYAAALDGNYFRIFSRVHPKHRFPYVSLLIMGGIAALFCFLRLADVIAALVVIRIIIQFLAQTIGIIVLRVRRPDLPRPFRMWLYPLPALIAFLGFVYVLFMRKNFLKEIRYAAVLIVLGLIIYLVRARLRGEWPFGEATVETARVEEV